MTCFYMKTEHNVLVIQFTVLVLQPKALLFWLTLTLINLTVFCQKAHEPAVRDLLSI